MSPSSLKKDDNPPRVTTRAISIQSPRTPLPFPEHTNEYCTTNTTNTTNTTREQALSPQPSGRDIGTNKESFTYSGPMSLDEGPSPRYDTTSNKSRRKPKSQDFIVGQSQRTDNNSVSNQLQYAYVDDTVPAPQRAADGIFLPELDAIARGEEQSGSSDTIASANLAKDDENKFQREDFITMCFPSDLLEKRERERRSSKTKSVDEESDFNGP